MLNILLKLELKWIIFNHYVLKFERRIKTVNILTLKNYFTGRMTKSITMIHEFYNNLNDLKDNMLIWIYLLRGI